MTEPRDDVQELLAKRTAARERRDWAEADAIRDQIRSLGWTIVDEPGGGSSLEPAVSEPSHPLKPSEVEDVTGASATADVSLQWVCEGWPEDIERAIGSFRANAAGRSLQIVVADVTGQGSDRWGQDVEVIELEKGTGWAAARNAGLRRAGGDVVVAVDGSVEAQGDALGPLVRTLEDEKVGVAGPFGIVTRDLRGFEPAPEPGDCDAIEGYMMGFRRELLSTAGFFDEKFRWYRTADIEWSFRVKDAGLRTVMIDLPVIKHEHRMWFETPTEEREKLSKRNYYRFLDRWRDRWDLVLSGEPDHTHDHDHHQDH